MIGCRESLTDQLSALAWHWRGLSQEDLGWRRGSEGRNPQPPLSQIERDKSGGWRWSLRGEIVANSGVVTLLDRGLLHTLTRFGAKVKDIEISPTVIIRGLQSRWETDGKFLNWCHKLMTKPGQLLRSVKIARSGSLAERTAMLVKMAIASGFGMKPVPCT